MSPGHTIRTAFPIFVSNRTIQRGAENQNMGWLVSLFKPDLLP
jgi:hypothetical protein